MGSLYSANFRLYRTFHGHHKAINCLRFNQDSDLLASAGTWIPLKRQQIVKDGYAL